MANIKFIDLSVHTANMVRKFSLGFLILLAFLSSNLLIGAQHEPTHAADNTEMGDLEHEIDLGDEVLVHSDPAHPEKFDAGKMIIDHVSNAHGWHLWGTTELALPVIIYNKTKGKWDIFGSDKFEHGHATYLGYSLHGGIITDANQDKIYDFSLTKNGAAAIFGAIVLIIIMLLTARNYKKRGTASPKGIASFVEPMIIFLRDDVIKPSIGKGFGKFVPYLLTLFFFIFINNLFGLIPIFPGGANVMGSLAVTAVLAIITFIITTVNGSKDYWMHILWPPGVPVALKPLIIVIEIVGIFTKPIVLMIRLFANITAGHIIILGFFSLIFIFAEMNSGVGIGVSIFSVVFTTFMSMLELLVAFLQAYVFTLLTALYIGAARETHSHEEAHH